MGRLCVFLSTCLGLGYLPKAPGTFGTLGGVLIFYLLGALRSPTQLAIVFLLFCLSLVIVHFAEKHLKSHDSGLIVLDEVLGYLVTVIGFSFSFWPAALGFVFFRIFDIWKPFPIRKIDQKLPGSWGVILDDILAGVYANIVLRIIFHFWEFS